MIDRETPWTLWKRATTLMESYYADVQRIGDADQAIELYQQYLEISPTDADVWFALGSLLASRGRLRRGAEALETAIRLAPEPSVDHLVNLGLARRGLGEWSEAAEAYEAALRLAPDDVQVLTNLAIALVKCGRDERSLELLKRALELEPSTESRLNLATEMTRLKSYGAAESVLREGLAHAQNSRAIQIRLAEVLVVQDRAEGALPYAKMAHAQDQDELATVVLANALSALKRHGEARDLLRGFIQREPDCWFPLGLFGAESIALGNGTDAVEAFQAALRVAPTEESTDDMGRSGTYWGDWLRSGLAAGLALAGKAAESRLAFEALGKGRSEMARDFPEFFAYDLPVDHTPS